MLVMAPITLVIFGLGVVGERIRPGRHDKSGALSPVPGQPLSPSHRLEPGAASWQRKLDDETRRQRNLTIQLGQREADLGRREADLRLREALLLSESQPQPVSRPLSAPESKPSFDPAVIPQDRLPDQFAPARFCFNCGAWFTRDDETCRLCGARRVGSEA